MPFPNYHACRLRQPGLFRPKSFRNVERAHDGKKYLVIRGILKRNGKWEDQAFRYPKATWSVSEARAHCKEHKGILFEPATGAAGYSRVRWLTDVERRIRGLELAGPQVRGDARGTEQEADDPGAETHGESESASDWRRKQRAIRRDMNERNRRSER